MRRTTTLISPTFLHTSSSIRIGRLVLNIKDPAQDYLDLVADADLIELQKSGRISVSTQSKFSSIQNSEKGASFRLSISRMLSASYSQGEKRTVKLTSLKEQTHQLNNSGELFKEACSSPRVRDWIQRAIKAGTTVYFVVGYRTLLDPEIVSFTEKQDGTFGGDLKPGSILSQDSFNSLIENVDPLEIEGQTQLGRRSQESRFLAEGERIYAVQYRKVDFKWSKMKRSEALLYDKNKWKVLWDLRGKEVEDTCDVVEADLSTGTTEDDEEADEDDLEELEEEGEEWEKYLTVTEDSEGEMEEEFLFPVAQAEGEDE